MVRYAVLFLALGVPALFLSVHAADLSTQPLPSASSIGSAPSENRYDVLSKMITPMAGVLLGGTQTTNRALTLSATVDQVAGRLPQ